MEIKIEGYQPPELSGEDEELLEGFLANSTDGGINVDLDEYDMPPQLRLPYLLGMATEMLQCLDCGFTVEELNRVLEAIKKETSAEVSILV